jgi:hypothetical protein
MWIYAREGADWVLLNAKAIQKIVARSDGAARPQWSVRIQHVGGGHDTLLGTFASEDEAHKLLKLLLAQIEKNEEVIDFA